MIRSDNHLRRPILQTFSLPFTALPSSDQRIQTKMSSFHPLHGTVSASEVTEPLQVGGHVGHVMTLQATGSHGALAVALILSSLSLSPSGRAHVYLVPYARYCVNCCGHPDQCHMTLTTSSVCSAILPLTVKLPRQQFVIQTDVLESSRDFLSSVTKSKVQMIY